MSKIYNIYLKNNTLKLFCIIYALGTIIVWGINFLSSGVSINSLIFFVISMIFLCILLGILCKQNTLILLKKKLIFMNILASIGLWQILLFINNYFTFTVVTYLAILVIFSLVYIKPYYFMKKRSLSFINALLVSLNFVLIVFRYITWTYYDYESLRNSDLSFFVYGFMLLLFFVILLTLFYKFYKNPPIHKMFFCVSVLLGVLYLTVLPPISAPDEDSHFAGAYSYSNVLLGGRRSNGEAGYRENGNNIVYQNIPCRKSDEITLNKIYDFDYVWQYPGFSYWLNIKNEFNEYTGIENQFGGVFQSRFAPGSSFISYLPSIVGITIGRIVGLGTVQLLFLGRLLNLLFYCVLISLAIKKIPFGKIAITIAALFPMSLHLAASFSYDAVLISSCVFFISYVLYLAYTKEKIYWMDILILLLTMLFVSSAKVIYSLIALLIIIIPIKKFASKKNYFFTLILLIVIIGLNIYISSGANIGGYLDDNSSEYFTLAYSLNHIGQVIRLIINSYMVQGQDYLFTMIGQKLGWLDYNIPIILIFAFMFIIIISIFIKDEIVPSLKTRIVSLGIFALIMAGFTATVVMWTPLQNSTISGMQGRYFLEIFCLLLISLVGQNNKLISVSKDITSIIVYTAVFLNILSLIVVFNITMLR